MAYADEALCIICIVYIIYITYRYGIKGKDLLLTVLVVALSLIGFAGNIYSKIVSSLWPILIDFIAFTKVFLPFLVYKKVARYDKKQMMALYLVPFAKVMILSGAIFGFISLFADIGMSGEVRYGIGSFNFIFGGNGGGSRYGYIVMCCLLILTIAKIPLRRYRIYEIAAIFIIIIITKGSVYLLAITYIVLMIMWRYSKTYKFTISNIVVLAFAGSAISTFQINTYIRDSESPRMVLIRYGAVTANRYFPLGAGFASYASDQANKNYSSLYYTYGFNKRYGMSPNNPSFLNDGYLGMIFGEFGWIGAAIFIALVILVFYYINKTGYLGKQAKALNFAVYISLIVSAFGTAIIKSNIGVMCFMVLGMASGYAEAFDDNENKQKLLDST